MNVNGGTTHSRLLTLDPELAPALHMLLLAHCNVLLQEVEPTVHLRCAFTRTLNLLLTLNRACVPPRSSVPQVNAYDFLSMMASSRKRLRMAVPVIGAARPACVIDALPGFRGAE
jgi:hypothetical protein